MILKDMGVFVQGIGASDEWAGLSNRQKKGAYTELLGIGSI
jgi:hypothetical protein